MIQISQLDATPNSEITPMGDRQPSLDSIADAPWSELIPADQWSVYERVLNLACQRNLKFALGGGLAFSHYANRWRNTKDLDLYIRPQDKDTMISVLHEAGLKDYFDVKDYDRGWIYRSHDNDIIVDIIWQMANYRAQVDDNWISRGDLLRIRGWPLRLLPVEELLWSKLYVLQRERCDWGDLLNILYARGEKIDWNHLLARVGEDKRVLAALVELFTWACPDRARDLPIWLWGELGIESPTLATGNESALQNKHIRLLDSRDWFGPNQEAAITANHSS